jgi:hypothetical protein
MTIRETIHAQWKAMKDRPFKEKLSFFWDYYGIKTICILIAVAVFISFVVSIATQKDSAYFGVFFGATSKASSSAFLEQFSDMAQIDTKTYDITIQTTLDVRMDQQITTETLEAMQSFAAMVAASMVDNFAADKDLFLYYCYLGYTTDLRTVFTPEQLEALAEHLHYVDGELLQEQENAEEGLTFDYGQCPDSKKPELMQDPIPVGIDISAATEAFLESYSFASEETVIGICAGSARQDIATLFLQFTFGLK